MAKAPLVVIAAGGSGGHMFPAQALAQEMMARGWRVKLSTDARGARYAAGFPDAVHREIIRSATFARGGAIAKLVAPMQIFGGILAALWSNLRERPEVVAGFGGYPSIPALTAAILTFTPRVIHEQNGKLGRVNWLFARFVPVVACGTWPTIVPGWSKTLHVGNPVRPAIREMHGTHYRPPSVQNKLFLVVIGGSQGAAILSRVVPDAIALLPLNLCARLSLSQQARPEDAQALAARYAEIGVKADIKAFFDDLPQRLAEAQLVISRSGASSVADIALIGRPAILIPYAAAIDDHQSANARALGNAGAAFLVQESDLTAARLAGHLAEVLGNPELARDMAASAAAQGRPDAAERLADLVETVAAKGKVS